MELLEADMSDVMNNRERGEERKYQMDQEMQFKVEARRNNCLLYTSPSPRDRG